MIGDHGKSLKGDLIVMRKDLGKIWDEHVSKEFVKRNLDETMATMSDDPYIKIIPINIDRRGKEEVRSFYRDVLIPSLPADLHATLLNRVIGDRHVVDEIRFSLTHTKQMDWLLPNLPPTNKRVELDHIVVVEFSGDKVAGERVYWDQATVLRQVGLLKD